MTIIYQATNISQLPTLSFAYVKVTQSSNKHGIHYFLQFTFDDSGAYLNNLQGHRGSKK